MRARRSGAPLKVRVFYERRTPYIRYFVAKPSIVAIYSVFERLSQHPASQLNPGVTLLRSRAPLN